MSVELTPQAFELLREMIRSSSGIDLASSKAYLVQARLGPLLEGNGCADFLELHAKATRPDGTKLREAIVDAMTTNETLWFRDDGPWKVLRKALMPAFCERLESGEARKIRIWSAASSTGQEPYSVAMVIRDYIEDRAGPGVKPEAFEIIGTDLSPSALFVAMTARYDQLAASRGLDPDMQERHFKTDGDSIVVRREVKSMVRFQQQNLIEDFSKLGPFDLVLCRNVLIYFANDTRKDIVGRIAGVLRPGGALILGGAESLQGALALFKLNRAGTSLYYVAKDQEASS